MLGWGLDLVLEDISNLNDSMILRSLIQSSLDKQYLEKISDWSWLTALLLTLANGSAKILLCFGISNISIPKRFVFLYTEMMRVQ